MTTRKSKNSDQSAREEAVESPQMKVLKKMRIVIRAAQRHSAWVEKQCGVTGAQLWVMKELHDAPGLRVGEVAGRLAIHQTTMSNLLDALVKKGYVKKERDQIDQRVVKLVLSEEGHHIIERAPIPARGLLQEALLKLDQKSLDDLNSGLQALLNVIDRVDEDHALQPMPFMM